MPVGCCYTFVRFLPILLLIVAGPHTRWWLVLFWIKRLLPRTPLYVGFPYVVWIHSWLCWVPGHARCDLRIRCGHARSVTLHEHHALFPRLDYACLTFVALFVALWFPGYRCSVTFTALRLLTFTRCAVTHAMDRCRLLRYAGVGFTTFGGLIRYTVVPAFITLGWWMMIALWTHAVILRCLIAPLVD